MTKEVLLSIRGLQFDGDSKQDLETLLPAEYYNRNGKHYVIYEEVNEGFQNPTKNVLKFNATELDVMKRGDFSVHMLFEENKKNLSPYSTPFGDIMVGIRATKIEVQEEEEKICLDVEYDLELNYQHLADCKITVDIRPLHKSENLFKN